MSTENEIRVDPENRLVRQTHEFPNLASSCSRRTFIKSSGMLIVGFSFSGLVKDFWSD